MCRIWLPNQDSVALVPRSALRPLSADLRSEIEAGRIAYVAAAAKVTEVLEGSAGDAEGHVLQASMESNVISLPRRIHNQQRRETLEAVPGRPWSVPVGCCLPVLLRRRLCCVRPRVRNPPPPWKTRMVGLVVDKVGKIMHGTQLGSAKLHNQIKQWRRGGFLAAPVDQLLKYGYEVWLTADHGNIQCDGKDSPPEGEIAETCGERVRVHPTPELRAQVTGVFPFAHERQPVGLPADYFPLPAGGRDAFVNPGDVIVGHGGVAIEEVIVPLVKFERRTR